MKKTIRIATRKSPLALWQAEYVKQQLLKIDPDLEILFVGLTTQGDREQSKALTAIGGKSLFVKELQKSLLDNNVDIAVHSIKDMSVQDCPGLTLAAICKRDDPRDAFISKKYRGISDLPKSAVIGTASPRRTALLKAQRPDLQIKLLRGNVGTRLDKVLNGGYDAIILAVAGVKRLGLDKHITEYLDTKLFIPAIGQAAIGVECRDDDTELRDLLKNIHHIETAQCVTAERAVNCVLGGDCHTPVAAYAIINDNQLQLHSMVGSLDGATIISNELASSPNDAEKLGKTMGNELLKKGAGALLNNKDKHV